jgi:serine/threonine protein kinase/limonene-1,2-epoxide hydrolase
VTTGRIGQQLGHYRLIRLLGQGGFAEVYLGEHIHLNTQAAIKVLRTQIARDDVASFRTEARTIAHLKHPNIVPILDFGVENDTPFLVMEYAPAGNLRQRHPRGIPLPLPILLPYVKQVASALQYAHIYNLIHRDVKPENMLLNYKNDILLSDFGIALVIQSTPSQSTKEPAGTWAYMAPEQIQGRPCAASDQYALGIVVYEWLTGVLPFQGNYVEVASQHLKATPPPMSEKLPTVLPDVEKVVLISLAKDPKQRFGSAQAFANALEQAYQTDLSTRSMTPGNFSSQSTISVKEPIMEATLNGPSGRMVLRSSIVTLGSMYDNLYVISEPSVSPHHAEIRLDRQGYSIIDLSSTNGTFVNSQPLNREMQHLLKHGDRIQIGNAQLLFEMNAAPQYGSLDSNRPTERASYVQQGQVAGYGPQGQVILPPINNTGYGGSEQQGHPSATPVRTPPGAPNYTPGNATPVLQSFAQSASWPGTPPPGSMQQQSQPVPPPPPNPRRRWLLFGIIGLVVLIVLALIGYIIFPRPTPAKALDDFCNGLQSKNYQAAYSDLSSGYQNKVSLPEFQGFFANVSSCTHGSPSQNSNSATASLTTISAGQTHNDTTTLTQGGSGSWQIVDFASLSVLTKTLDTYCYAWLQGDYPTAYNQLSGTMQTKMSEQLMRSFFPKVITCKYDSLAMSANGATVVLTSTTTGTTETDTVSLVQDSSNGWKIADFANLPDKTLNAFCNAVQAKDYTTAYREFSVGLQANYSQSQFAKDYASITSCVPNPSNLSGGTIVATITLGDSSGNKAQVVANLIQDNSGYWKIDDIVYLPDVPLNTFCNALQQKDYQTAYNQLSVGAQNRVTEQQLATAFASVTTCTHDTAIVSGNTATATITLGDNSGNTVKEKATLIQDNNGDWKIDNLQVVQ